MSGSPQEQRRAGHSGVYIMLRDSAGVCLSALFIDFDNIYLSLKGRDEEAAARFSRNPSYWLSQIVSGALVRADPPMTGFRRRIAVGRCYGNPVPRRSGRDGVGDPTSFAYMRHNFMRAGLEIVDCPHLTSQFKNSSDIRIACDVRDYRDHATRFDEFIILSGDADFTPVLLSLRSHARQTVIYANEYTSPYYKAFADARVEEDDLIRCLMHSENVLADQGAPMPALEHATRNAPALPPRQAQPQVALPPQIPMPQALTQPQAVEQALQQPAPSQPAPPVSAAPLADASRKRRVPSSADAAIQSLIDDFKAIGTEILELVLDVVDNSEKPVPLAYLADRAQKTLGHAKTIGTNWAGSGGFLNFLTQNLPESLRLSEKPPHFVYNPAKHRLREEIRPVEAPAPALAPAVAAPQPAAALRPKEAANSTGRLAELQRSITRIYEACQAPPLPPSEYQVLFALIANEVRENNFTPERTASAVVSRAAEAGLKLSAKDVGFVIEAIDEVDPWLEHTRSPSAVARAYRDYVFARCSQAGVQLSDDEYQLVQVWFGASQWTGSGGNEGGAGGAAGGPGGSGGPADLARRFALPEAAGLPSPSHNALPPLDEYEQEQQQQAAKSPLRYSFLKHG
jgi:hypothetical protein